MAELGGAVVVAGFDDEAEASAAARALGGSLDRYDPSRWASPEPVVVEVGASSLTIDAATAFGHGEHPTTRLILDALVAAPPKGSVLDVGSGTGILAIAAARLGAERVVATDNDPAAVAATEANAATNGVAITVGTSVGAGSFDVVMANLLLADLAPLADEVVGATGGRLIVSGFLADQVARVEQLLAPLRTLRRHDGGDWVCLELTGNAT